MKTFKLNASSAGNMMTGTIGITEKQKQTILDYELKPKLTKIQSAKLQELRYKRDNPELPATVKSLLKIWCQEQIYKARHNIHSKYLTKGTEVENEGIDLLNLILDSDYNKYEGAKLEDDYFKGYPDILPPKKTYLRDIKSSWDVFSFPTFENELPDSKYAEQMQVYMHLTGRKKAYIDYVLINTPEDLVSSEAHFIARKNGTAVTQDIYEFVLARHCFDDIDQYLRYKCYEINYDPDIIKELKFRIDLSRDYINSILTKR